MRITGTTAKNTADNSKLTLENDVQRKILYVEKYTLSKLPQ